MKILFIYSKITKDCRFNIDVWSQFFFPVSIEMCSNSTITRGVLLKFPEMHVFILTQASSR